VKNIFVGNLDFAATDSSVRAMFERYGTVDRVNLVTDRDTGRSRGFAFVEMSSTQEADRAIAGLNGADFEGRALNVNEARPKGLREEPPWRPSTNARRKCIGWNANAIRLPNERKSRRARPPESQMSQIAIAKHPKTLRHLTPQQIHRR